MADFRIKTTVWLHGHPWRPGQEASLERAGFSDAQKIEEVRRGTIAYAGPPVSDIASIASDESPDATLAALQLAEEHGIDLSTITGTGENGRITKADVQGVIE